MHQSANNNSISDITIMHYEKYPFTKKTFWNDTYLR